MPKECFVLCPNNPFEEVPWCQLWPEFKYCLKLTHCSHKHRHELSFNPLFSLCLTSGNAVSCCVNRSVADRGSRAMIGLRISAFSVFAVTKIYNRMAYDTLVKATKTDDRKKKAAGHFQSLLDLCLPFVTMLCCLLHFFITHPAYIQDVCEFYQTEGC